MKYPDPARGLRDLRAGTIVTKTNSRAAFSKPQPPVSDTGSESMVPRSPAPPLRRRARRTRAGFSLVELMLALVIMAIMMAIGSVGVRSLATQQNGERLARAVLWETTLARTYAIRFGQPLALVADKTKKQLILRDSDGQVYRTMPYTNASGLIASSLSTNVAGDSIAFSGRGYCLNCSAAGTTAITVSSKGRAYSLTVNSLGRAELVGLPLF